MSWRLVLSNQLTHSVMTERHAKCVVVILNRSHILCNVNEFIVHSSVRIQNIAFFHNREDDWQCCEKKYCVRNTLQQRCPVNCCLVECFQSWWCSRLFSQTKRCQWRYRRQNQQVNNIVSMSWIKRVCESLNSVCKFHSWKIFHDHPYLSLKKSIRLLIDYRLAGIMTVLVSCSCLKLLQLPLSKWPQYVCSPNAAVRRKLEANCLAVAGVNV